jgi:integrase
MQTAQKIARYLWHNPDVPHIQLAAALKIDQKNLWAIRHHLGLPKLKRGRPYRPALVTPDPKMQRQLSLGGEEYLVFPNRDNPNRPYIPTNAWRWASEIQLAANLIDTTGQPKYKDGKKYARANHVWRHYFVTLLLSQGWQWKQIANLSGHTNAAMVMNTYGHLVRDIKSDYDMLLDAMNSAMGPPKLRVVEAGKKLLGTKTADFGTGKL